jgi:hypothetical protein
VANTTEIQKLIAGEPAWEEGSAHAWCEEGRPPPPVPRASAALVQLN